MINIIRFVGYRIMQNSWANCPGYSVVIIGESKGSATDVPPLLLSIRLPHQDSALSLRVGTRLVKNTRCVTKMAHFGKLEEVWYVFFTKYTISPMWVSTVEVLTNLRQLNHF